MDIRITINRDTARVEALTLSARDWLRDFAYTSIYDNGPDVTISAEAAYEWTAAATEAGLQVNAP